MIKEEYVSFRTAMLLKEKGFDAKCQKVYVHTGNVMWACCFMEGESFVDNTDIAAVADYKGWNTYLCGDYAYLCPTLQMARKWLREDHNLLAEPYRTYTGYSFQVGHVDTGIMFYDASNDRIAPQIWSTYEKAEDAAIAYCLGLI